MKIALLHYSSPPIVGGVESVLAQHARLMTKAGHSVSVFTGRGEDFQAHIPVCVFPLIDSRNPEVLEVKRHLDDGIVPSSFEELRSRIERDLQNSLAGFDLLIAHNVASLHKNLALTAAIKSASQRTEFPPLILWHHDLAWTTPRYRQEMHPGYPWDLLRTDWGSARHVVVSELRRRELADLLNIPPNAIRVVPNGVDINMFFKLDPQTIHLVDQMHLLDADPLLLLPVRITPRKNIELALNVLAELRARFPQAMLLVTGPEGPHNPANGAYRSRLLELRDRLGLQGAAHFLADVAEGFIPDEVIADFYRLSDALLFPSLEEGFGIPVIEAAFDSMPVFYSDIPVLRELCGEDGTYFDPAADPASIAALVYDRLQSEITSRWARRARHIYTWDSIYTAHIGPLLQEFAR
jgi:glycosyltransferase involved in cell wall biosynthesis